MANSGDGDQVKDVEHMESHDNVKTTEIESLEHREKFKPLTSNLLYSSKRVQTTMIESPKSSEIVQTSETKTSKPCEGVQATKNESQEPRENAQINKIESLKPSELFQATKMESLEPCERIQATEIDLPTPYESNFAIVLEYVLTDEKCDELIQRVEPGDYNIAYVQEGGHSDRTMFPMSRSRTCSMDPEDLLSSIWEKTRLFIPTTLNGRNVQGLSPRVKMLLYQTGEYYKLHKDGRQYGDHGEESLITMQICLNTGFEGGATTFISDACEDVPRVPVYLDKGSALLFDQDTPHEGSMVTAGHKNILRLDVMYLSE